jgi:hypothetical protein
MNAPFFSDTGRLVRPAPGADIRIVRIAFDIVNDDTNQSIPLDEVYNHHIAILTRPRVPTAAAKNDNGSCTRSNDSYAANSTVAADLNVHAWHGSRAARGFSAVLSPCGATLEAANFFIGIGAEWRGWQKEYRADNPWGPGVMLNWVEPAGTEWGGNMHFIDLRGAESVAHTVQCNCAYNARGGGAIPGAPRNADLSPLSGGGFSCCGDGTASPVTATAPTGGAAKRPIALLYNVSWLPANATSNLPRNMSRPFMRSLIMVGLGGVGACRSHIRLLTHNSQA